MELFYEDTNYGDPSALPVVLGHSFLGSGEMWAPLLPTLASMRRVVNVDLRGHGQSSRSAQEHTFEDLVGDVLRVLDELAIERAVLAGLSIGGMTAMRFALRYPDRVGGLILINADAGDEDPQQKLKYRAWSALVQLAEPSVVVRQLTPLMFGADVRARRPGLVDAWAARWRELDVMSAVRVFDTLMDRDDVRESLGRIRCPTLVIHGAEDRLVGRDRCRDVARRIPGSAFQIVERGGHLVTLECPDAVSALFGTFLPGIP